MLRRVFITGSGKIPLNVSPAESFASLSRPAIDQALSDAGLQRDQVDCVVVGNMLSPILQKQSQLAAKIVMENNLQYKDTMTIDAACGSGGAAIRAGMMAILSGIHSNVLVVGIEQMIHHDKAKVPKALAQASDWEKEGSRGLSFIDLNDKLMVEYIKRYNLSDEEAEDFFYFSEVAHANAMNSDHALLRKPLTRQTYRDSRLLAQRVRLFDACPIANGCAAIVLSSKGRPGQDPVILGSDLRTDILNVKLRRDLIELRAVKESVENCIKQAGIRRDDIDFYEAHDAYSIMSALSLEVCGFVAPGESLKFARDGQTRLDGQLPMSTFGGLKARGHPVGASGVYQFVEIKDQLQGKAGKNQVGSRSGASSTSALRTPKIALTSSFGGAGTVSCSHIVSM